MCGVTLSHQPLDEILVRMHRGTPIPQHKSWIPNSTQIIKLYHKEELVEKGRSYTRGKGQQNSVPYTEFCMGGEKVVGIKKSEKISLLRSRRSSFWSGLFLELWMQDFSPPPVFMKNSHLTMWHRKN